MTGSVPVLLGYLFLMFLNQTVRIAITSDGVTRRLLRVCVPSLMSFWLVDSQARWIQSVLFTPRAVRIWWWVEATVIDKIIDSLIRTFWEQWNLLCAMFNHTLERGVPLFVLLMRWFPAWWQGTQRNSALIKYHFSIIWFLYIKLLKIILHQ